MVLFKSDLKFQETATHRFWLNGIQLGPQSQEMLDVEYNVGLDYKQLSFSEIS